MRVGFQVWRKGHNDVRVQRVLGIHVGVTNLFATDVPTSRTIQGSLHSICKYGGEQRQHYCSYQDPHYTKCTSTEGFRRLITVPNEEKRNQISLRFDDNVVNIKILNV